MCCCDSNTDVQHLIGDWTQCVYSMSPQVHAEFVQRTSGSESASKRKPRSKSDVSRDDVFDVLKSLGEEGGCERLWAVDARPDISTQVGEPPITKQTPV